MVANSSANIAMASKTGDGFNVLITAFHVRVLISLEPPACFVSCNEQGVKAMLHTMMLVRFFPDVGGHGQSVDIGCDARKPVAGVFEVGDNDAARAGLRIGARHRLANAARRSGNDADFVFDVHAQHPVLR